MISQDKYNFSNYKEQKFKWDFWEKFARKNIPKSGTILEIGCAYAYLSRRLEKDYETFAIDSSQEALDIARTFCTSTLIQKMDAQNLEFKKGTFDAVFCLDLLEHLKQPEKCIKRCSEILNLGGFLIITTPNPDSLGSRLKKQNWFAYKDKTHLSIKPAQEWKSLLEHNNFKTIKMFTMGFFDIPYFRFIPAALQKIFLVLSYFQYKLNIKFPKIGENLVFICKK
ncbi:class I SAM-dependent methyltransferase [archaeon]|nr:class I SAM-dependent methyltransferase [archaeon]